MNKNSAFIHFYLTEFSKVQLYIVDKENRKIAQLIEEEHRPIGQHSWTFKTSQIPPGVYTLFLKVGEQKTIQKFFTID